MRKKFLVLAISHNSYLDFLRRNNHLDPRDFHYIGRRSHLLGMFSEQVGGLVYWEGWEGNPAYDYNFLKELDHQLYRWKFIGDKIVKKAEHHQSLDLLREKGIRVIRI